MQPEDAERIRHILDACDAIAGFIVGRQRADLASDQMLLFAIVRALEVIGEASSRVSDGTRANLPAVPWGRIRAMRNRLAHAYFAIDPDVVWRTATEDVPSLASLMRNPRLTNE